MEGLVYIGHIIEIKPIENADKIEAITVVAGSGGKWQAVSQKGNFKEGDLAEVYLQDSLLPKDDPRFSFMEKYNYRIKMQRLRGAISECLCLPITVEGKIGDDITEKIGVTKYEKPIAASLAGQVEGSFPSFLIKTDQRNFQGVPNMLRELRGNPWLATVKYDGTSCSIFKYKDKFGVCSRNLQMKEDDRNIYWKIAKKYKLEESLLDSYCIQMEIIGPGIQGNPCNFSEIDCRVFDVFNISERRYISNKLAREIIFYMPWVDIVQEGNSFDLDDNNLRCLAEGCYPNGNQREGIVIKPQKEMNTKKGNRLSFKVINLNYKG